MTRNRTSHFPPSPHAATHPASDYFSTVLVRGEPFGVEEADEHRQQAAATAPS
jgi:hypothetical protein